MTIPAPDGRIEDRDVQVARLRFNRAAVEATAWLRQRVGPDYQATMPLLAASAQTTGRANLPSWIGPRADATQSVRQPGWLGGAATNPDGTDPDTVAMVNNVLAASGIPPYSPSQEDLDAARARFEAEPGGQGFFSKINRVTKTATNLGLQAFDLPLEVARNNVLGKMRSVDRFVDDPSVTGFFKAVAPLGINMGEAVADTTVNAFINTVQEHGLDYALGPQGIGTGYTLDPESEVALQKEMLAEHFWKLDNGDAATIGRWVAQTVSTDPGTTPYSTISGVIDAATLILDPMNVVAPEAKLSKLKFIGGSSLTPKQVAEGGAALADLSRTENFTVAAEGVRRLPGAAGSQRVRDSFDTSTRLIEHIDQIAANDPVFASKVEQAVAAKERILASYTADKVGGAQLAAAVNHAALTNTPLQPQYNTIRWGADTVSEAVKDAVERVDDLTTEIARRETSLRYLKDEVKRLQAQGNAAGVQANLQQQVITEAERITFEAERAAQEAVVAQVEGARRAMLQSQQELDALQVRYDAEAANLQFLDAAREQMVAAYMGSHDEMMAATFDAMQRLPETDFGSTWQMLRALFGVYDEGANLRTSLGAMVRGSADIVAETAARIDDFTYMRDLFPDIGAETAKSLVLATDPQEAMVLLMDHALNGDIKKFNHRARAYLANRGERIGSQGHAISKWESRLSSVARRTKPRADWTDVDDLDEMVDLTDNQIADALSLGFLVRGSDDAWEFRREWLNRMAAAETWVERKREFIALQQALVERIPGWDTLPKSKREKINADLGRVADEEHDAAERAITERAEMSHHGAESGLYGYLDAPTVPDRTTNRLIRSGVDISRHVRALNTDELRKLYRNVDEAVGLIKAGKWTAEKSVAMNDIFDETWRSLFLAFRPGYMVLQVADGATRSLLTGATTGLAHPLTTTALASSLMTGDHPRLARFAERMASGAPVGADGLPMFGSAQRQWYANAVHRAEQTASARHLMRAQFRDFDTFGGNRVLDRGWKAVHQGQDGFHYGWAQDALRHLLPPGDAHDPMYQAVLSVRADGALPDAIEQWAAAHYTTVPGLEDAVTDYFHVGPGKQHLADIAASGQTSKAGVEPRTKWVFRDREKLKASLFAEDDAYSVHTLVKAHTGGFHTDAVNLLRDVADGQAAMANHLSRLTENQIRKAKQAAFMRDVRVPGGKTVQVDFSNHTDAEQWAGRQLKGMRLDEPVAVQVRDTTQVPAKAAGKALDAFNRRMQAFFGLAGLGEKRFTHSPFMRDEIILQTAKRIPALSAEDAQVVGQRMLDQIPRGLKPEKLKQARSLIRQAMRQADGTGVYTVDDITRGAERAAFNVLEETFYGLKGRNLAAQRMALLWPFVQASANGYRVYVREMARNPTRVINTMRAWENAHTEESGTVVDLLPGTDRADPTQPLVWHDAYGNQQVSVPFLGYVRWGVDSLLGATPFYDADPTHSPYMDVNVSKWNPMNFGEPLPGVGMGVTVPVSLVRGALGSESIPTWMEDYVFPFEPTDVDQDQGFLQQNAPWFLKPMLGGTPEQAVGTAMSALVANYPEKYIDPATGYVTEEAASRLTKDAASYAKTLHVSGLAWSAIARGGQQVPKTLTGLDGRAVAASVVYAEYQRELEETTSGQAMAHILDTYGVGGLAYVTGKSETVAQADDDGYQFARANPEVLEASPDVLGYFFPASELKYRSPGYQRLLSELDRGERKDPREFVESINRTIHQARVGRLEEKMANGEITDTEFRTTKAFLSDEYGLVPQPEFSTSMRDQTHEQLRAAMRNQELLSNPVGQSLQQFYSVYDQIRPTLDGETFSGKKDAAQRDAMLQVGEALARANIEFQPLWDGKLKWEFMDD